MKPSSLGDVVSAVPVLAGLRRTFPRARISWLVTPACSSLLDGQDGLDEVILFDRALYGRIGRSARATWRFLLFCRDLRRRRFDWVIDLQGLFRSGFLARLSGAAVRAGFADAREFAHVFYTHPIAPGPAHTIDRNIALARAMGVDAGPDDLKLTVTGQARAFAESFIREHSLVRGRYVVIAPGTRWQSKLYPARLWKRVIAGLSRDVRIVLIGSGDDRPMCEGLASCEHSGGAILNVAGRTSLRRAVALIEAAGVVICCDSAPNFIAPAVGTASVTLIGPTRAERTGPYGRLSAAIVAEVPCQGCLKRRCQHVTCMQLIDPRRVVAAAAKALGLAAGS